MVFCSSLKRVQIEPEIENLIKQLAFPVDHRIEWKDPENEPLYTCDLTNTVIPSRFIHHLKLVGSKEQQRNLIKKFIVDLQKITSKERTKFRTYFFLCHFKQMQNVCLGKDTQDVDLNSGTISYSGMGRKATKYSLLRPIQYGLDLILIDAIKKKLTEEISFNILENLPRQVPHAIDYMYKKGLLHKLSDTECTVLKQAYIIGLVYFQIAQHLFSIEKQAIEFTLSCEASDELKCLYKEVLRILNKIVEKKED